MWTKLVDLIISNLKWIVKALKKVRYKYLPLNFDIAISIKSEEGLNSGQYYKQLNLDFTRLLHEHKLTNNIRIKNLSDIIEFNNEEEAANFVKKKNLNLLIWGEFSVDNLKENNENINQLVPHFTFLHPFDNQNLIGHSLNTDISTKDKLKGDWVIHDKNSFPEIKILSRNIFDISIYTVAVTLKFFNYWYLSVELLEKLFLNTEEDAQFKLAIDFHLKENYDIISRIDMNNDNYKEAEIYLVRLLKQDSKNYLVMSNLALCKFKNGKIEDAEKLIEEAYKLSPNHPLCQINFAYLCIRKSNYKKAYRMYQKFFDHNQVIFQPLGVIDFLNNEYNKIHEPALLYGSGIMNYIFLDRKMGIRDLKKFIRKADKITMEDMIKRASQLIKQNNT